MQERALSLKEKIGQRLMIGLPGYTVDPTTKRLIEELKISNFVLFRRNLKDSEQIAALCESIQELVMKSTGHGALISIDQEGGVVTRLPETEVNCPGAMAIAATNEPENAYIQGKIHALELKKLGINCNLAPDLDINNNGQNPVIGVRSYGDTAETVRTYGVKTMQGLLDHGVIPVVKHFPGHGNTDMDSHISLPVVGATKEELKQLELVPFQAAIKAGVPMIMSSHILYPQVEKGELPATMSRTIIHGLLKEEMGFQGVVISDCMEMDAIGKFYGTVNGVIAAMKAGVDLVLVSHTQQLQEEAALAVEREIEAGNLSMEEMDACVSRILALKERLNDFSTTETQAQWSKEEMKQQSDEMLSKSIVLVTGELKPLGEHPFFVGCTEYRATLASDDATDMKSFSESMKDQFGGDYYINSSDPTKEEIQKIIELAKGHTSIVFSTYNAHFKQGQIALGTALEELKLPMTVIAFRNPYDLKFFKEDTTTIAAWEYTSRCFDALVPYLRCEKVPTGKLPIQL